MKANSWILGVIILVIIACVVAVGVYMGFIPLSLATDQDDGMSDPIGSDYCGFAVGDIIGMFENLVGKDLNNDVGYSVVNALNMKACGSGSKLPSEIITNYKTIFAGSGWYLLAEDTQVRSGYYYTIVVWGNAPLLSNSSLIKGVISGNGVTVDTWYGYKTITIVGEGTRSGYLGFVLWLTS